MTKETKDNLNKKDTKETANTSDKNPKVIELTNDIKRIRADFENYRKRTELDIESARRNGGDAMILKLLPVIDTLERAISHIPSDIAENSWVKGVSGVAKNLNKTLKIDAKPDRSLTQSFIMLFKLMKMPAVNMKLYLKNCRRATCVMV